MSSSPAARGAQEQAAATHVAASHEGLREQQASPEDLEQGVDVLPARDAAEQDHARLRAARAFDERSAPQRRGTDRPQTLTSPIARSSSAVSRRSGSTSPSPAAITSTPGTRRRGPREGARVGQLPRSRAPTATRTPRRSMPCHFAPAPRARTSPTSPAASRGCRRSAGLTTNTVLGTTGCGFIMCDALRRHGPRRAPPHVDRDPGCRGARGRGHRGFRRVPGVRCRRSRAWPRDSYWLEVDSPWCTGCCCSSSRGAAIPARAVGAMVAALDALPLHTFPAPRRRVASPGVDRARATRRGHRALGSIDQVLSACGVDVDGELPIRPWFERYQMRDGGLNCDESAYLVADECPSSMVGRSPGSRRCCGAGRARSSNVRRASSSSASSSAARTRGTTQRSGTPE